MNTRTIGAEVQRERLKVFLKAAGETPHCDKRLGQGQMLIRESKSQRTVKRANPPAVDQGVANGLSRPGGRGRPLVRHHHLGKDRFVLGRANYQRQYEPIWYGWRYGAQHYWKGDRDQGDVWRIERPSAFEANPTQEPLDVMEKAIENGSRPSDLVDDGFLGSGSSLIACERTGRISYGVELDETYASIVLARWETFSGAFAEKVS